MVFAISADILPVSYFDQRDGRVSLVPEGGASPYTYLWDSGETTADIIVTAGIYTVIVTDANGQTVTATYTVSQPTTFRLDVEPYAVALLSDSLMRDLYCRKIIGEGIQTIGRGQAAQAFYLRTTATEYAAIGTVIGKKETDGSGGLTLSVYDGETPYDILHLTKDGLEIHGNVTITGATTEVVVNDIKVNDKTISLSAFESTGAAIDGSGILLGSGSAARSLLYSNTADALVSDASVFVKGASGLRIGDTWSSATTTLTKNTFTVSNGAPSIVLDGTGLTLTNCLLVDPIPITDQIASDQGITDRTTGKFFGWDSTDSVWSTSGDTIRADSFGANGATFSGSGFTVPASTGADTVSVTPTGFSVPGAKLLQDGLDLTSNDAGIYFGNRAWRIVYDVVENALVFQKFEDGDWTVKLNLD